MIQLRDKKTLPEVLNSFKKFTSKEIRKTTSSKQGIWQDQYYDHLIRRDESLSNIIKYCFENPVRKGMVEDPNEYPFWCCQYGA